MISEELFRRAGAIARLLAVLGNTKRFLIVCHLLQGELSVGAIAERVDLSQSALSQHLAKLRSMDLVETRRVRQTIYYSCKSEEMRALLGAVDEALGGGKTIAMPCGDIEENRQIRS
jgi:DNA-binding transcriptional ArsR family regulator